MGKDVASLVLSACDPTRVLIVFDDERDNADAHDQWEGERALASVTIESDDSSWGEFLSARDIAEIHAWTGALLSRHYAGPVIEDG